MIGRALCLGLTIAVLASPAAACTQPVAGQEERAMAAGIVDLEEGAMAFLPAARDRPLPVMVLLHGAGGDAAGMITALRAQAEAHGVALVAPRAAGATWDLILSAAAYREDRSRPATLRLSGGDSERIERALERLDARADVDRARVTLAGFSDGASYALSIGPLRPDLYRAIIAFSPGFAARPPRARGRQPVLVSHGERDRVLAFARTRDTIVPALRAAGHAATFEPFAGGHIIPDAIIADAMRITVEPTG